MDSYKRFNKAIGTNWRGLDIETKLENMRQL